MVDYYGMVPPKALLPHETFESTFDYFDHEAFTICCRHSMRGDPVDITKMGLSGLRVAKKGTAMVRATVGV